MPERPTNEELVARYRSGDQSAFDSLVQRNQGLIRKFASRGFRPGTDLAEAVESMAIEAVWKAAQSFDPEKGAFSTYLAGALRYVALNVRRRQRRDERVTLFSDLDTEDFNFGDSVEQNVDHAALEHEELFDGYRAKLRSYRSIMDPVDWQALKAACDGQTYEKIGANLGVSRARVGQRINRARDAIRTRAPEPEPAVCEHQHIRRHGFDRLRNQRYRCMACGITWRHQAPLPRPRSSDTIGLARILRASGFRLPESKIATAVDRLKHGFSLRTIAREVDASKCTVRRLKLRVESLLDERFVCPCGKPSGHRGWCAWRISQSPGRQAYLQGFGT